MAPKKVPIPSKELDVDFHAAVHRVVENFQLVHQTMANTAKAKKNLLTRAREDEQLFRRAVSKVSVGVLNQVPQLTPDTLRRHCGFLRELCKSYREQQQNDLLAVEILNEIMPAGKAANKSVRLVVVTLFEEVLSTLDPSITTKERQDFYEAATTLLKYRAVDTCPHVREKAVAALASFQAGRKDDDVTCLLISTLVEDLSAEVRRQVLRGTRNGNGDKRFLHVYYSAIVRCTQDISGKVREAAWEAFHRFRWNDVVQQSKLNKVDILQVISRGLKDASAPVATACRLTLLKSWLQRDNKDNCIDMLEAIAVDDGDILIDHESASRVAKDLVHASVKVNAATAPLSARIGCFRLNVAVPLTFAKVLLWKACCKELMDGTLQAQGDVVESEVESTLLLPLDQFAEIVQDTMMFFAKPEEYKPKKVQLAKVTGAEDLLTLLFSALLIYAEGGFLDHVDNATRCLLLKQLGFLLKVVPDSDPCLFVESIVRGLRVLTARHPEEATTVVHEALNLLFSGIQLRKQFALTFDDVEAFGKMDAERRLELKSLRYRNSLERAELLESAIEFDQKFLLRMTSIVFNVLVSSHRMEKLPSFCPHVVQLGRQQCDPQVKTLSTRALAMICLINPETVHTFIPILLRDANEAPATTGSDKESPARDVAAAALGAVFDVVCEYGFNFFNSSTDRQAMAAKPDEPAVASLHGDTSMAEQRKAAEALAAEDAVARQGGSKLLKQLETFLLVDGISQRQVASLGFCKLFACNRVPEECVPRIMAQLLLHTSLEPSSRKGLGAATAGSYQAMARQLASSMGTFFDAYSQSSWKRQTLVAEGGIIALRILFLSAPTAIQTMSKLLNQLIRLTDAANLRAVREVDPEFAQSIAKEYREQAEVSPLEQTDTTDGGIHRNTSKKSVNVSAASTMTRKVTSARLRQELSRFSLHEYLAEELLIDAVQSPTDSIVPRLVVTSLKKLRLYSTNPKVLSCLLEHVEMAKQSLEGFDEEVQETLKSVIDFLEACGARRSQNSEPLQEDVTANVQRSLTPVSGRVERRSALLEEFQSLGIVPSMGASMGPKVLFGFSEGARAAHLQCSSGAVTDAVKRPSKIPRASPVVDAESADDDLADLSTLRSQRPAKKHRTK
jgi:condensin complex subunit 3